MGALSAVAAATAALSGAAACYDAWGVEAEVLALSTATEAGGPGFQDRLSCCVDRVSSRKAAGGTILIVLQEPSMNSPVILCTSHDIAATRYGRGIVFGRP